MLPPKGEFQCIVFLVNKEVHLINAIVKPVRTKTCLHVQTSIAMPNVRRGPQCRNSHLTNGTANFNLSSCTSNAVVLGELHIDISVENRKKCL